VPLIPSLWNTTFGQSDWAHSVAQSNVLAMPSTQKAGRGQPHTQHIALAERGANPIRRPASSTTTATRAAPDAPAPDLLSR
jgi:hypothetical protein